MAELVKGRDDSRTGCNIAALQTLCAMANAIVCSGLWYVKRFQLQQVAFRLDAFEILT